tara:strand:+ start:44 stop:475 length:432 start_codon:yes stop_codon:yes gene_type:complete
METCTSYTDKYVQIDYAPKPEWKDQLEGFFHKWFSERHPKVLLAWHVCIVFHDKRKDMPCQGDKRKVCGLYKYKGDNSCEIHLWSKASRSSLIGSTESALAEIQRDFDDEVLHYNHEGHACHCSTGKKHLKQEKKWRKQCNTK